MGVNLGQDESIRLNAALNDVNASVSSSLEFDEIMQRVMSAAARALRCSTAGMLLRDGDTWVVRYVHGFPAEVIGRRYAGREMPHAMLAAQSRQVFVVPDTARDPRIPVAERNEYGVRAMMVVPVLTRDEAIGALFFNYADGPVDFSPAEVEFGQKLAGMISLALDNARLYEAERQGRALFQSMFDHAPTGILLLEGPELRGVMANPAYLQLLDAPWRSQGVAGARLADFLPGAEASGLAERFRTVGRLGQAQVAAEYHYRHPQRGDTYWRWVAAPVPVASGPQPKVMFLLSDVTEEVLARRHAETLAARVENYAEELEIANEHLQAQAEELQVQSEELRSQNDELMAVQDQLRAAHEELESRVQQRTAELAAANAALAAREASLRQAAAALETEVAERRRAQVELADQAERLREQAELLELTHDTILVRDLDAHILYWNRGAERQYGYRRAEVLGKRSHSLLKTQFPQPVREVYAQLLATGRWDGELVHTRRDGKQIVVNSRWALQRDADGKPVRVLEINNNITAHKQAEQELWRHTKRLQILHDIDLAVLAVRSVEEIAQVAVQHMRQLIQCERAAVVTFDFERGLAQRLAVDVTGTTAIPSGTSSPLSDYPALEEHRQGRMYAVDDMREVADPSPVMRTFIAEGLRSLISLPLLTQGQVTGMVNLAASRPAAFSLADVDVARQVADSLAVALEQARLYEGERHARQVAEALRAANSALTESLDLDTVLETLLGLLQSLVPYRSAQVLLLENDACLALRAGRSIPGSPAGAEGSGAAVRILDVKELPAYRQALDSRQSLLIPDTAEYPGWERMPMLDVARNWLGVPLVAGGRVLGLCSLYADEPGFFTQEHVRLAEALAGQAAVAVQNARLFRQVDEGRRQLQALSRRLVDVQEEERRYIARELHDEAGQALTSLMLGLGLAGREVADRPEVARRLQELKETTDGVMENLHRLAMRLRPAILDRLGLVPALQQYVDTFLQENKLEGEFLSVGLDDVHLPPEVEITVYRVVQEALTNVARHAHATRVGVVLERRGAADGGATVGAASEPAPNGAAEGAAPAERQGSQVLAIIEDDGQGFDPVAAAQRGRLGLFGMQERTQMLGGSFQVESTPGAGTTVYVEIPYRE